MALKRDARRCAKGAFESEHKIEVLRLEKAAAERRAAAAEEASRKAVAEHLEALREIEEKVGEETDRTMESSKRQLKELEKIAKKLPARRSKRDQSCEEESIRSPSIANALASSKMSARGGAQSQVYLCKYSRLKDTVRRIQAPLEKKRRKSRQKGRLRSSGKRRRMDL